jgi:O-acetylhomoserine (thiol)-lyase
MEKKLRVASLCVQGGYEPKNGEPIEVPIYQSTTFKYDNSEEMAMLFDLKKEGYFYTRLQNPTNESMNLMAVSRSPFNPKAMTPQVP